MSKRSAADFLATATAAKRAKSHLTQSTPPAADSPPHAELHALIYPAGAKKSPSQLTAFQRRVYALTRRIPAGRVATYKSLAESLSCPRAYRAVGNALRHNPYAPLVPCHRVLASDGRIGGFAGDSGVCAQTSKKVSMLKAEGIIFEADNTQISRDAAYRTQVMLGRIDATGIDEAVTDEHLRQA